MGPQTLADPSLEFVYGAPIEPPLKLVGCRGGSRHFSGGLWFLGKPKDSKVWLSKSTEFPRESKLMQNGQYLFEDIFDLIGFIYDFGIATIIRELLRLHHRIFQFWFNTLGDTNCFGPNKIFFQTCEGPPFWTIEVPHFLNNVFGFPKGRDMQI